MAKDIKAATAFWIHAGEMSGDPNHRHQVEFTDELARFFDDNARATEILMVRLPNGQVCVRPLTYRGTDYGQWTGDIWRLGLPTARMGGPMYAGRVIKFDRISSGGNFIYDLSVEDVGSATALAWQQQAQSHGCVGTTGGGGAYAGRLYGYW